MGMNLEDSVLELLDWIKIHYKVLDNNIEFKLEIASYEDIFTHLSACKANFIPPLNETINVQEYAMKIFKKSITFEAWRDQCLVGLISIYLNDPTREKGYITNVSVLKEYHGKRIASNLLKKCIAYTRQIGFKTIELKVNDRNISAIHLYRRCNFGFKNKLDNQIIMELDLKK